MSKEDYNKLFDYIYNILENEECLICDVLKRNIKKKYLLPQSFLNLFDKEIIAIKKEDIYESKYYKYLNKISIAIHSIIEINEDIHILKSTITKSEMLPNHFWKFMEYIPKKNKDIYKERPNYIEFIKNVQEQNFKSGITIQATGTGKSFQILKLIDIYQSKYNNVQNDYLLIAPKIDILRDMFFKNDILDKEKFNKLKYSNIIDIDKYNIVNLVTEDFNKKAFSKTKPNLIIANMQYLIFMEDKNVAILEKNLKMCIFDECHNVSGDEIFKFIEKLNNIINIGFSATPLRNTTDKLLQKFYKIYGDGKKINIISSFDIFDGIAENIILPFKHYFFEFKSCYKIKKKLHDDDYDLNQSDSDDSDDDISINSDNITIDESALDYNKQIVKDIIMKNIVEKLPYKKIICWCRTKKLAKKWKEWFENNFKSYKSYLSISGTENEEDDTYLDFKHLCPKNENDEIKAIKAILFCVGRCREGSDIDFVDCGIYLDPVKNRSVVVSMQTAGRIMRLDKYNKKTHAVIIEGYIPNNDNNKLNADLIISYYKKLLQISEDKNNYIDKLKYLHDNTIYESESKYIKIKIDDDNNHDCILNVNLKNNDWENVKKSITQYTKQQMNKRNEQYKELEKNNNIKTIMNNNMTFSKLKKVIINDLNTNIDSYKQLINYIYNEIKDVDKIIKYTILRIEKGERNTNGYKYFEDLNISIQGADAKHSILEIIRQSIINKLNFNIDIELKDKNIINLSNS